MKTANEIRLEMANGQRMEKTRAKWLEWCERSKNAPVITGNNNISLGDKVEFTATKSSGYGRISISVKKGIAFSFSDSGGIMMVASSGHLRRVSNHVNEEE